MYRLETEPTPEEVFAHVCALVEKAMGEPESTRVDSLAQVLTGDQVALAVLQAAYEEGREDAAVAVAQAGAEEVDPTYGEMPAGEMRATWRGENICGKCRHEAFCVVARAAPPDLLVAIRRCVAFAAREK